MKRAQKALRITSFLIALGLIGFILFLANALVGNPISAMIAKHKVEQYVNQNYGSFDLELENPDYNFKFGNYIVKVRSNSSQDTHFNIYYRNGKIVGDDYKMNVLEKYNTLERLSNQYSIIIRNVVEQMGYNDLGTRVSYNKDLTPKEKELVKLDMDFDRNLPIDAEVWLDIELKEFTPSEIAKILKDCHKTFQEQGYNFKKYHFSSSKEDIMVSVYSIPPKLIERDDFEEVLNKAQNEDGYEGIQLTIRK